MNWTRPYQEHQRRIAAGLREARAAGRTVYQTTHSARTVDPSRMSDNAIDMLALREAQHYVERSINLNNQQIDRQ